MADAKDEKNLSQEAMMQELGISQAELDEVDEEIE